MQKFNELLISNNLEELIFIYFRRHKYKWKLFFTHDLNYQKKIMLGQIKKFVQV